jgi:hypothetical protein
MMRESASAFYNCTIFGKQWLRLLFTVTVSLHLAKQLTVAVLKRRRLRAYSLRSVVHFLKTADTSAQRENRQPNFR